MKPERAAAHTPREGSDEWHDLEAHLQAVAEDAEKFAGKFNASNLGRWLGLLHDIGKYNPEFQKYLEDAHKGRQRRGPPHAVWGAALIYHWLKPQFAEKRLTPWQELTPPIAGHHGGLKPPGLLD